MYYLYLVRANLCQFNINDWQLESTFVILVCSLCIDMSTVLFLTCLKY